MFARIGRALKSALAAHGIWALVVSILTVLPLVHYLRNQKAVSEASIGALLPFAAEASAEASDSPDGLVQAQHRHAKILRLYIRTLDRQDIASYLNIGRPAALRAKLSAIADDLEKGTDDPAAAIKVAAQKTYDLYAEFKAPLLGLPTFNRDR